MIPLLLLIATIIILAVFATVVIFTLRAKSTSKANKEDRFNWWLPLFAAVGALILFLPIMIYGIDIDEMLYIFIAAPIVSFILLIFALIYAINKKWLRSLAVLSMLIVYCTVSWGLFKNSRELHRTPRWLLRSKEYKAKILAQPNPAAGELRHIEWDAWGFAGVGDTDAYLVFDPNDSLTTAAKSHSSGKFSGIPCKVYRVDRLESHYYAVLFYTDTNWGECNLAGPE
jgi:hypothetical protein